jgi:hypothetical protein
MLNRLGSYAVLESDLCIDCQLTEGTFEHLDPWGSDQMPSSISNSLNTKVERDENFTDTSCCPRSHVIEEQTAAGYLRFHFALSASDSQIPPRRNGRAHDEPQNSLYDVRLSSTITTGRVGAYRRGHPLLEEIQPWRAPGHMNSQSALDALAKTT